MAPIHDTDVAEKRWEHTSWRYIELWEKLEQQEKRNRLRWIFATFLIFVLISAVPVLIDRAPYWEARKAARLFVEKLAWIKTKSSLDHHPLRIKITEPDSLTYSVEKVASCGDESGEVIEEGQVLKKSSWDVRFLTPTDSNSLDLSRVTNMFCFDPTQGAELAGQPDVNFGVIPVSDLASKRMDRIAFAVILGKNAQLSFY